MLGHESHEVVHAVTFAAAEGGRSDVTFRSNSSAAAGAAATTVGAAAASPRDGQAGRGVITSDSQAGRLRSLDRRMTARPAGAAGGGGGRGGGGAHAPRHHGSGGNGGGGGGGGGNGGGGGGSGGGGGGGGGNGLLPCSWFAEGSVEYFWYRLLVSP